MKSSSLHKFVAAALLLAGASQARADIQLNAFNFNGSDSTKGIVYDVGGTTPLSGPAMAQIFAGAAGATFAQLLAIGPVQTFLTGGGAGVFNGGTVTLTSASLFGGQTGVYQIRAWKGGTSYGDALNTANGVSAITSIVFGGTPSGGGTPITPPDVSLHPSFALTLVPEPSILALGMLGAAGLLLRRRK